LILGRNTVSDETAAEVLGLVDGVSDPLEKAKIVYEYVQSQVRYINVAIGIGGWQPAEAKQVDQVKYGDCKGLSNYTQALLSVVGVEARWTVLYSNKKPQSLLEDFPSLQGNHMILNIPLENEEDLWLECTSSYLPFGYVGSSNQGQKVLVVGESGGEIKEIKAFQNEANLQHNIYSVSIENNGDMLANTQKKSMGSQYDERLYFEVVSPKDAKNRYLSEWSSVPKLDILAFAYENDRNEVSFHEEIELVSRGFAKKIGNRLMFKVNPLNTYSNIPRKYNNRTNPFDLGNGFKDVDEYIFELPSNYTIEALPENISLKSPYGSYSLEMEVEENKLLVKRTLQLNAGIYP